MIIILPSNWSLLILCNSIFEHFSILIHLLTRMFNCCLTHHSILLTTTHVSHKTEWYLFISFTILLIYKLVAACMVQARLMIAWYHFIWNLNLFSFFGVWQKSSTVFSVQLLFNRRIIFVQLHNKLIHLSHNFTNLWEFVVHVGNLVHGRVMIGSFHIYVKSSAWSWNRFAIEQ